MAYRPPLTAEQRAKIQALRKAGRTAIEIAKEMGLHRSSVHRILAADAPGLQTDGPHTSFGRAIRMFLGEAEYQRWLAAGAPLPRETTEG